jgi:hypothetical protein
MIWFDYLPNKQLDIKGIGGRRRRAGEEKRSWR